MFWREKKDFFLQSTFVLLEIPFEENEKCVFNPGMSNQVSKNIEYQNHSSVYLLIFKRKIFEQI